MPGLGLFLPTVAVYIYLSVDNWVGLKAKSLCKNGCLHLKYAEDFRVI